MLWKKLMLLFVIIVGIVGCYPIDRVRPTTIKNSLEKNPERGILYVTYSYENPKGEYLDALGIYRFLWNYKQPLETYYLLEMENKTNRDMVVYHTAPTVINPVDFVLSNTIFETIMLRHNFPEQPIYVQKGEIIYLGHIYIRITNSKVGFIPTTSYKLLWEDHEEKDKAALFASFPMLSNWVWKKQIIELYVKPTLPGQPAPAHQTTHPGSQVIYVTNVVVVTNTTTNR